MLARDRTRIRAPKRYEYEELIAYSLVVASEVLEDETSIVSFALASKEKTQWLDATNEEMKSLHLNNTWTLVCRLVGSRLVSCKWISKHKDGNLETGQQKFKGEIGG